MRRAKVGLFSVLMILTAGLLAVVSARPPVRLSPFDREAVNQALSYQLSALPVAGLALVLTFAFAGRIRLRYLNLNRKGAMGPLWGASDEAGQGRWETDAWAIGLVMVTIVGVATVLQLGPAGFAFRWEYAALAVPLAAMNAFTEEVVFRLSYVTVGDSETGTKTYGLVMGSAVFGIFHYWGIAPSGLAGAAMSAFMGYFLARSIQETKGFFWAFVLHFMFNNVMMLLLLNSGA